MAKLKAHGMELARFKRTSRRENTEFPESFGSYIYFFSFRSDGQVLRKVQFRYDIPGANLIDYGWRLWKKLKAEANVDEVIQKWAESGKYERIG